MCLYFCLDYVMTSWHNIMTSQNSLLRYQLGRCSKMMKQIYFRRHFGCQVPTYYHICICMMSFCHNVTSWRHWHYDMTSMNLFPTSQPANVLESGFHSRFGNFLVAELNVVINIVVAWWNNVNKCSHDVIIHCTYPQLVEVLERWFFFCFYGNLACRVQKYHRFCIYSCRNVITWLHDVTNMTIWRHKTHFTYISL